MTAQSLIANAKAIVTQKYFCFEGRADRAEFWQFFLVVFIVNTVLGIVDSVIGIKIFSSLFSLAVLAPMLGCGARRLHDINKSGWLQLLGLIPVLGVVILIIFWAKPGDNTSK